MCKVNDQEYEFLAEILLLNAYKMSVIGNDSGILEVLLEVPLRRKAVRKSPKLNLQTYNTKIVM